MENCSLQAKALNRMGIFVEEHGKDKVLSNEEMDKHIKKHGKSFDTYAGAFDFKSRDIAEFYNNASQNKIKLNQEELMLEKLLLQTKIIELDNELYGGTDKVLLTLVQKCREKKIPIKNRYIVLTHEVKHGIYFTNEKYKNLVDSFWNNELNIEDRSYIKRVLSALKIYNTNDKYLVRNEFQAYFITDAYKGNSLFEHPLGWMWIENKDERLAIGNYASKNRDRIKMLKQRLEKKVKPFLGYGIDKKGLSENQ